MARHPKWKIGDEVIWPFHGQIFGGIIASKRPAKYRKSGKIEDWEYFVITPQGGKMWRYESRLKANTSENVDILTSRLEVKDELHSV